MALVKNIDFHIHGYDDFIERVLPELDVICNKTLADPEGHFQIAIMEAVNNAAQYSLAGLTEAAVDIKMSIRDMDIKVSVSSETREFDVKEFDVSKDNIADMAAAHNPGTVPAMPRSTNIPLPAIPNHPMQAGIPQVSNPSSNQPPASSDRIAVQGIAMGENGSNIAIMSDGKVVSEGDVYRDNRIAYIGGDGITFDNGTKVRYE